MSHWVAKQTEVLKDVNEALLGKALSAMGLGLNTKGGNIANVWGSEQVDYIVTRNGSNTTLGFVRDGNSLVLKGDFFSTGVNESTFMDTLSQSYQGEKTLDFFNRTGWIVELDETNAESERVVEAYQYA